MPFSFNPTVASGNQDTPSPQGGFAPSESSSPLADAPSVGNTPFLFFDQRAQEKSTLAYVQIVAGVLFILSIIASITLFGYSLYLKKSIEDKRLVIENSESDFKEYPYDEMRNSYKQLVTMDVLLKEYASARTPLLLLEKVVENEVLISNFNLTRDKSGKYNMQLTAVTTNYKVLVQQLEALKLASFAKVAPTQTVGRIEESKQNKNGQIKVQILVPLNIQGVLADTVIFDSIIDSGRTIEKIPEAANNSQATSTNQN